jgi:uncharacterized protein (DUF1330 family)
MKFARHAAAATMNQMSSRGTSIHLCCLLRARPGAERDLNAYEDAVLALVPEHGGELLSRVIGDGSDGHPHEVHVYRFPGKGAIDSYMADPRRLALAAERDRVVARTAVVEVTPTGGPPPELAAGCAGGSALPASRDLLIANETKRARSQRNSAVQYRSSRSASTRSQDKSHHRLGRLRTRWLSTGLGKLSTGEKISSGFSWRAV